MAGLQYNFFPTDFCYPRPQSADAGRRAVAVNIQTQKKDQVGDDLEWPKSLGFRVHQSKNSLSSKAEVSMIVKGQKNGTISYVEDGGKLVKYSPNPLSCFTFIPEVLSDSS